jgi:hypothetical protein
VVSVFFVLSLFAHANFVFFRFANNVNERQRLINTMTRGRFNASTGSFETIRDPDYHMIWIVPPAHSRRRVGRRLHRLAMRAQVPGVRPGPRNVPVRRHVRMRRGLVRTRVRQAMRLLPTRGGEERAGAAGPDGGCHAGERGVAQRVPDSTGE